MVFCKPCLILEVLSEANLISTRIQDYSGSPNAASPLAPCELYRGNFAIILNSSKGYYLTGSAFCMENL